MTKRRKKSSKKSSKFLLYIVWTLAVIALILSSLVAGYYFGYADAKEDSQKKERVLQQKRAIVNKVLKKSKKKYVKKSVNKRLQAVLSKEKDRKEILRNLPSDEVTAAHEYDDLKVDLPPKRAIKIVSTKPKLAIIIDDVSLKTQVDAIKSLKLPLTMSFMPPRAARPNSAKLASRENFYMVHLPLGAMHFSKEEPKTLHIHDSQQTITQRVKEIKRLFPRVKYINNHTGSKFTSNEFAMNRLIYALKNRGIHFIDSRTTAKTKVPMVMKNFGLKYISRDVFLDHHMDKPYVLKQIKEAIRVAKLHGTAIAIGHPHSNTLEALYESKELLKQVDLVYVNRL